MLSTVFFSHFRNVQNLQHTWPYQIHIFKTNHSIPFPKCIKTVYCKCIFISNYLSVPAVLSCWPQKAFDGTKITTFYRANIHSDTCLSITIDILNSIIPKLDIICSTFNEEILFKAALLLAFHALFRVGKITLLKGNTIKSPSNIGM